MKRVLFDIETNGLLHELTKVHCLVMKDLDEGTMISVYNPEDIEAAVKEINEADYVVGHNIIDFDLPALTKLYPWFNPKGIIIDTLMLSRLVYPDIKRQIDFDLYKKLKTSEDDKPTFGKLMGRHTLESWGHRLGDYKGDFGKTTDWKEFSMDMLHYGEQDVHLNVRLYEKLINENPAEEAIKNEMETQRIISRQMRKGFLFDVPKAEKLYAKLTNRKEELLDLLNSDPLFRPFYVKVKEFTPKRDNNAKHWQAGRAMTQIKLVDFNPGSSQHIAHWLTKKYEWEPEELTATGLPKVSESVLSELKYPAAEPLIEYFIIKQRLGQLGNGQKAWLKMVEEDNRIHGYVNTNGTVTGRMSHSNPNMNIPAVRAPYGGECRELFVVPKGCKLNGTDASGLELRCLAHYLIPFQKEGEIDYAKEILEGDIHSVNMHALGLTDRDVAKTFIYAFIYGAGDKKIGSILGVGAKEGRSKRLAFLKKIPALGRLSRAVATKVVNSKSLRGLDGRILPIRSPRSALNFLLQSAGAVLMKRALIILDNFIDYYKLDAEFVVNVHDEWQIECKDEEIAKSVGVCAVEAIKRAGVYYNLRVPLDGESKIGNNWKETH